MAVVRWGEILQPALHRWLGRGIKASLKCVHVDVLVQGRVALGKHAQQATDNEASSHSLSGLSGRSDYPSGFFGTDT